MPKDYAHPCFGKRRWQFGGPFEEKMERLTAQLEAQFAESTQLGFG